MILLDGDTKLDALMPNTHIIIVCKIGLLLHNISELFTLLFTWSSPNPGVLIGDAFFCPYN
jgi:hypothetical protein